MSNYKTATSTAQKMHDSFEPINTNTHTTSDVKLQNSNFYCPK